MKFISPAKFTALGKGAIALILSLTGLIQIPAVSAFLMPLIQHHPHIATIVGGLTTISALLANPQVQDFFGIEHTVESSDGVVKETTTVTASKP